MSQRMKVRWMIRQRESGRGLHAVVVIPSHLLGWQLAHKLIDMTCTHAICYCVWMVLVEVPKRHSHPRLHAP